MTWLVAHMWLALLVAAFFGGLMGWACRHVFLRNAAAATGENPSLGMLDAGEASARFAELEAQLQAERDEVASLRAQAGGSSIAPLPEAEPEEGSVEWRNRYLESRVRFLEKQIAEAEAAVAAAPESESAGDDENTRLVWRNRYLEGRVRYLEDELSKGGTLTVATVESSSNRSKSDVPAGQKPQTLDGPRNGRADNLKKIGGVGPKIEKLLNGLGVYHFDQIASWTDEEIAWVNAEISFKGRIERENWVDQARSLAQGVQSESRDR